MSEIRKNIILFRGENKEKLRTTIQSWREKFIEKHGEMNLLDIKNDNIFDGVLGDCLSLGFMGSTRMIIFYEKLIKTDKEQEKIQEQSNVETINTEELFQNNQKKQNNTTENDDIWIETLAKIPETNFVIFIGNKKPITNLEKWLEKNATIHNFPGLTVHEMITYIETNLRLPYTQAEKMSNRLNNNPDYIRREVDKLSLAFQATWTDQQLREILPDYRDENAFNMLNPLWERDYKNMNIIWRRLMETADHELSMAMMITMIRKILISATFNQNMNLPITPGQKNTGRKLLPYKKNLKKLYDEIIAVDIAEKSGELPNKANAFLMTLLNFC